MILCLPLVASATPAPPPAVPDAQKIDFRWGVRITLRDGVALNAALYLPKNPPGPAPCIVTMTPYTAQTYHDRGVYFAAHGLPFLSVDVRGRGGSAGLFKPFLQEARDSADVVEWIARQPYCNGKVAMWGGSYAGYDQWSAASMKPPHLATIVPVSSPFMGVDAPGLGNIQPASILAGGIYMSGSTSQAAILADGALWAGILRERFEAGAPFATLGSAVSDPALIPTPLREWAAHPDADAYWDAHEPTDAQFAAIDLPILTITGFYDVLQRGSIEYYRRQTRLARRTASAPHYLVIGPWDHGGTRTPRANVGGLGVAAAGLPDLQALHLDWYKWTMAGGARPAFLEKPVAYYVMGAERWRYADSLAGVTAQSRPYALGSAGQATTISGNGALIAGAGYGPADRYVYDPRDVGDAALESQVDPNSLVDTRMVMAREGKHLVYHTAPFATNTEVAGFFRLSVWMAIDQPDTDFEVAVYEVTAAGNSILLTSDQKRARYRLSERKATLAPANVPLRYDFDRFAFIARRIAAGSRIRLVIGPINSIYVQKNYNSGGDVSLETLGDARTVTVSLLHDRRHPSTLYVPIGQSGNEFE